MVTAAKPVQAPALGTPGEVYPDTGETILVAMTTVDALGVGHSMRSLVRQHKLPPGTAEIYERVALSMIEEARKAIAQQQATRKSSRGRR